MCSMHFCRLIIKKITVLLTWCFFCRIIVQLGRICLDILKDKWSPALQIRTVLLRSVFGVCRFSMWESACISRISIWPTRIPLASLENCHNTYTFPQSFADIDYWDHLSLEVGLSCNNRVLTMNVLEPSTALDRNWTPGSSERSPLL